MKINKSEVSEVMVAPTTLWSLQIVYTVLNTVLNSPNMSNFYVSVHIICYNIDIFTREIQIMTIVHIKIYSTKTILQYPNTT